MEEIKFTSGRELPSVESKKRSLKARGQRELSGESNQWVWDDDETYGYVGRGGRVRRDASDGPPLPPCNCDASESGTFTGIQSTEVILLLQSIPIVFTFMDHTFYQRTTAEWVLLQDARKILRQYTQSGATHLVINLTFTEDINETQYSIFYIVMK